MTIQIVGAPPALQKKIREIFNSLPSWVIRAARLSRVEVTNRDDIREQVAAFEHDTRTLYLSPAVSLLRKALIHELGHALDDVYGQGHFFSSSFGWTRIHQQQLYFDLDKYREQPLEYFSDMFAKYWILGPTKLATTNPHEVEFLEKVVFNTLIKEFE